MAAEALETRAHLLAETLPEDIHDEPEIATAHLPVGLMI